VYARTKYTNKWNEIQKIPPSDGSPGDRFGFAVSLSGDEAVVGAPSKSDRGLVSGAAYIFGRDQGGRDNWGQVHKLLANDGSENDQFGFSVTISGGVVVIGAFGDDLQSGAAYVFARDHGGANSWGQICKIRPQDSMAEDRFGFSVSLFRDLLLVGAPSARFSRGGPGAAYTFSRNQGGSENWGQVDRVFHFRTAQQNLASVLLVNTTARKNLQNEIVGVFCIAQNITELVMARETAIRERERACAESDLNLFLAHEVRNPLSAALTSVKFAQERLMMVDVSTTVMDDVQTARISMEYTQELLNNLMDLGKHLSSPLEMNPEPCSILEDVLRPVLGMISFRAASLDLILECHDPLNFHVDKLRLQQVLLNICSNAVKFTSQGFVKVCAHVENGEVVIAVSDSGPGIPKEFHNRLFQKFTQVSGNEMRGSGVGLCLSKMLVNHMGGTLSLDTRYCAFERGNKGCRFVLRLKLQPWSQLEEKANELSPLVSREKAPVRRTPATLQDAHR